MIRIIGLIADTRKIDPFVMKKWRELDVRIRDCNDAENLENALVLMGEEGINYSVEHRVTERGYLYVYLGRR